MMNKNLEKAIKHAGGLAPFAKAVGVSTQLVHYWRHKAKRLPAERVIAVENAVDGFVTRSDLRPDLFPPND